MKATARLHELGQSLWLDNITRALLDKGILALPGGPSANDKVPFSFDVNNGGWLGLRHPYSRPGGAGVNNVWEWQRFGLCGFQSAIPDADVTKGFQNNGAGIWHTGDGNAATPADRRALEHLHAVGQVERALGVLLRRTELRKLGRLRHSASSSKRLS